MAGPIERGALKGQSDVFGSDFPSEYSKGRERAKILRIYLTLEDSMIINCQI